MHCFRSLGLWVGFGWRYILLVAVVRGWAAVMCWALCEPVAMRKICQENYLNVYALCPLCLSFDMWNLLENIMNFFFVTFMALESSSCWNYSHKRLYRLLHFEAIFSSWFVFPVEHARFRDGLVAMMEEVGRDLGHVGRPTDSITGGIQANRLSSPTPFSGRKVSYSTLADLPTDNLWQASTSRIKIAEIMKTKESNKRIQNEVYFSVYNCFFFPFVSSFRLFPLNYILYFLIIIIIVLYLIFQYANASKVPCTWNSDVDHHSNGRKNAAVTLPLSE